LFGIAQDKKLAEFYTNKNTTYEEVMPYRNRTYQQHDAAGTGKMGAKIGLFNEP